MLNGVVVVRFEGAVGDTVNGTSVIGGLVLGLGVVGGAVVGGLKGLRVDVVLKGLNVMNWVVGV